jgi:hypothetical protein
MICCGRRRLVLLFLGVFEWAPNRNGGVVVGFAWFLLLWLRSPLRAPKRRRSGIMEARSDTGVMESELSSILLLMSSSSLTLKTMQERWRGGWCFGPRRCRLREAAFQNLKPSFCARQPVGEPPDAHMAKNHGSAKFSCFRPGLFPSKGTTCAVSNFKTTVARLIVENSALGKKGENDVGSVFASFDLGRYRPSMIPRTTVNCKSSWLSSSLIFPLTN